MVFTATDPITPLENLLNQAVNDGAALANTNRQIQTFRWANAAARTTQAGMQSGDIGFQIDTGVHYEYASTGWFPGSRKLGGKVLRANTVVNFAAATWQPATTPADWTATGGKPATGGVSAFSGAWTVPVAGYYRIEAQVALNTTANLFIAVKKNDTSASNTGAVLLNTAVGTSSLTVAQVSGTVRLAANDVLRVFVFPSVASAWNQVTDFSYFGIEFVEPI